MKRRKRFSAERVANAQVRQLEDEKRVHESREKVLGEPLDIEDRPGVTAADRVRLLYGLRV